MTGGDRFATFCVSVKDTDLWIAVPRQSFNAAMHDAVEQLVWRRRRVLEDYLEKHPGLVSALEPCLVDETAPGILKAMVAAGNRAGIGPMGAVAGAFAEIVGNYLLKHASEVIVENGGDLYLKVVEPVNVGIFAGNSPLSGKLALSVEPGRTPVGIGTSSGTVGHSFSRGRADAAVALSASATLADAAATAIGNLVLEPSDLEPAVEYARCLEGITGAVVICRDKLALWGDIVIRPV